MAQSKYDIGRPTGRCAHTNQPIEVGTRYVAALIDVPGEEDLARVDYSRASWDEGHRPDRLFASWRAIMPAPTAGNNDLLDTSSLLSLFDSLEDADDPRRTAFRVVLGLLLLRKRLLIPMPTPTDGDPSATYVRRKGEPTDTEPFALPDPAALDAVDAQTLAAVRDQLRLIIREDDE